MNKKEIKYLALSGISDKSKWSIAEQKGYIRSLSKEEKREFDSYDERTISGSHEDVRTGMKCPHCGELK